MIVLGFPDYRSQGQRLAAALGCDYKEAEIHHFPDGESRVTLPIPLPANVVFCRSLNQPNDKLIELLLAAETARQHGATRLLLVAPYLCYLRQDIAFHPGEAISQQIIGKFIAGLFDTVLCVQPHLHRVHSLIKAIPARRAQVVDITRDIADFIAARTNNAVLIGPDSESRQWVEAIAGAAGLEWDIADKQRRGDNDVVVTLPDVPVDGRDVVLIDDIASTGHTLANAAIELRARGAAHIEAFVTHALFAPGAQQTINNTGIETIWSTDSIEHETNAVQLAATISKAIVTLGEI